MTDLPLAASSNQPLRTKRIEWIDCAKFVAIIAVVVDHTNGLVYTNRLIAAASYFSVSLFILLSGITTWTSYNRWQGSDAGYIVARLKSLFLQYAFATFVILCVDQRFFDLDTYIDLLLHFNAVSTFYFLAFFFQLILVAPMLVQWCGFCNRQKATLLWQVATIACLCVFACFSYKRTLVLPLLHGGGKYLLGATYVILYYIGMLFASNGVFERTKKQKVAILAVSAPAWIAWWLLSGKGILPYNWLCAPFWGNGFNPPGLTLMVFSMITLFLLYAMFSLLTESKRASLKRLSVFIITAGRYSLFVFMYHILVRNLLSRYFPALLDNMWLARFFVFIPMIVLPILAAIAWERLRRKVFSRQNP